MDTQQIDINNKPTPEIPAEPIAWAAKNNISGKILWSTLSYSRFEIDNNTMHCTEISKEMLVEYAIRRTTKTHQYVANILELQLEIRQLNEGFTAAKAALSRIALNIFGDTKPDVVAGEALTALETKDSEME